MITKFKLFENIRYEELRSLFGQNFSDFSFKIINSTWDGYKWIEHEKKELEGWDIEVDKLTGDFIYFQHLGGLAGREEKQRIEKNTKDWDKIFGALSDEDREKVLLYAKYGKENQEAEKYNL